MGALTVLYLILPFPVAFILHDLEEIFTQHKWILAHQEALTNRFPKMGAMLEHLGQLNTKAFSIAAAEELLLLLIATAYLLVDGPFALPIWSALFIAFSLHLLVHIGQAIAVKGYVPGVVTSILLLPYCLFGMQMIWNHFSLGELLLYAALGIILMVLNLRLAHWLGIKFGRSAKHTS